MPGLSRVLQGFSGIRQGSARFGKLEQGSAGCSWDAAGFRMQQDSAGIGAVQQDCPVLRSIQQDSAGFRRDSAGFMRVEQD